ncbi:sensor histidine kinase [Massilia sp. 9096]|uniref:sensor histidine kinase n=1 Tax=Massilia sp. 9096 TaxID=1500894 RepID=UPI00055A16EF|nr:sensor histidine kinase [Massilia sp. 9096]
MKLNRIGIALIASALLVIALVVSLLVMRQQDSRLAEVRVKGAAVARSLSSLPIAALKGGAGNGLLGTLFAYHDNGDFAYAAVTDAGGRTLTDVAGRGTLVPGAPLPVDAAGFNERLLPAAGGMRAIHEFYGPLLDRSQGAAFVRVGFYQPAYALLPRDVSFLALLALMMFMLVPLIYMVVKREMAPLDALGRQLRQLAVEQNRQNAQNARAPGLEAACDVRELAHSLQSWLQTTGARIAELEHASLNATADNRVLQYGSKKLTAALQSLPDGLLMLAPGGVVSFASDKIEPLLGVPLKDILEQPFEFWCRDPALRALLARYDGEGIEASHALRPASVDFTSANVEGKYLSATAQPLTAAHGQMAFGTLVVVRDVTREQLARQAGNDFVAHVSHELKSPLNVIGMYAETLADADDESLRVESLNVIQDEIERMNALVGNLLNVSKLETGSMSPERNRVRLDDLLRDAYDNALPRATGKQLRMALDLPRELEAVAIDKDLFRIALNNLLTNAIKYNRPGGSVTLSAHNEEHEIVIKVTDTGIGIGPQDREHVFDKFYRAAETDARTARGGHGLGLYLTAQIVELHHGRVSVDSELGTGSTFSIHLKIAPAAAGVATL